MTVSMKTTQARQSWACSSCGAAILCWGFFQHQKSAWGQVRMDVQNVESNKYLMSHKYDTKLKTKWQKWHTSSDTQVNLRKGWKIMTEDGESLDSNALRAVVGMIKEIEYQVGWLFCVFLSTRWGGWRALFAQCFVFWKTWKRLRLLIFTPRNKCTRDACSTVDITDCNRLQQIHTVTGWQ